MKAWAVMAKMGRAALVRMEKQLLRLGRGLNGERFAIQIGKLRDAAVRHYGDDLTADHVGAAQRYSSSRPSMLKLHQTQSTSPSESRSFFMAQSMN